MNPQQFAALCAKFLGRTTMSPRERGEFDAVEQTLGRMARGEILFAAPKKPKEAPKPKGTVS